MGKDKKNETGELHNAAVNDAGTELPRLENGPAKGAAHPGIVATGEQRAGEVFLGQNEDGVAELQRHPGGVEDKFVVHDPAKGEVAPLSETKPDAARMVVAED